MSSPSHILFNNLALAKNQLPAIILGFVSRDPVDESAVQVDVLCQAVRYRAFVSRLCGVSSLFVERWNFGSRFCWRGSPVRGDATKFLPSFEGVSCFPGTNREETEEYFSARGERSFL